MLWQTLPSVYNRSIAHHPQPAHQNDNCVSCWDSVADKNKIVGSQHAYGILFNELD
jgi:hypothetical protein